MSFILKKKRLNLDGIFDDGLPTVRRRSRSVAALPLYDVSVVPKLKGKPGPKPRFGPRPEPRPRGRPRVKLAKPPVVVAPERDRAKYTPSPEEVTRVMEELRRRRRPPGDQECE